MKVRKLIKKMYSLDKMTDQEWEAISKEFEEYSIISGNDFSDENIIDMVKMVKKDNLTKKEIHDVQIRILDLLLENEYLIFYNRKIRDDIKKFIRQIVKNDPSPNKTLLKILHNLIKRFDWMEVDLKNHNYVLKSIIDVLIWRFKENVAIRHASLNPKEDFIINKIGLSSELNFLEKVNMDETEDFAILNDISNCEKLYDLNIFTKNGFIPREVKKKYSDSDKKLKKQIKNIKKYSKNLRRAEKNMEYNRLFVFEDAEDEQFKSVKHVIRNSDFVEKYNWSVMENLIAQSYEKGITQQLVDDCILYQCINSSKEIKEELPNPFKKNEKILFTVIDENRIPQLRPFFLFDIPPEFILDILLHRIEFYIILSIDRLKKRFKKEGIELISFSREGYIKIRNGDGKVIIIELPYMRVLKECLSIESLVKYAKIV